MACTRSVGAGRAATGVAFCAALAGCAVGTEPLTLEEHMQGAQADLGQLFAEQEPLAGPIDLYEAMARALRYNLDARLRAMEEALAEEIVDVAAFQLLPSLDASAGLEGRSNENASSSRSIRTGTESLEPSISTDRNRSVADVTLVWNILDFGLSYYGAHQASDRAKIAMERRRKVMHDVMQDVRTAYWRAVASERLLDRIGPLMQRVERALDDSRQIEQLRLQSPLDALEYQRSLLEYQQQLQVLRRDLSLARTELAALMNLPPDQHFTVAVPEQHDLAASEIVIDPETIEILALTYRPELREERYQTRIARWETRRELLRILPGIEFDTSVNYDSNSFLVNSSWIEYGARVTWNLLDVLSAPDRIEQAEAGEEVAKARRLATSMAVLVQAHVAWIRYRNAEDEYETAAALRDVEGRIVDQLQAQGSARAIGDLPIIRAEFGLLLADLRRDLAYAELNNASGAVLLSIGADPVPAEATDGSIEALATAIRETEAAWRRGAFSVADEMATVDEAADGALVEPVAAVAR